MITGNRSGHFARECRSNFGTGGSRFGMQKMKFLFFKFIRGYDFFFSCYSAYIKLFFSHINYNSHLSFSGQKCYKCNRVGHLARDCQETEERCYRCNDTGHKSRDCNREKDQISCYNCKEKGHLVRDCPTKVEVCFACNLEGHISRNCPNGQKKPTSQRQQKSSKSTTPIMKSFTNLFSRDL